MSVMARQSPVKYDSSLGFFYFMPAVLERLHIFHYRHQITIWLHFDYNYKKIDSIGTHWHEFRVPGVHFYTHLYSFLNHIYDTKNPCFVKLFGASQKVHNVPRETASFQMFSAPPQFLISASNQRFLFHLVAKCFFNCTFHPALDGIIVVRRTAFIQLLIVKKHGKNN